MFQLAIYSDHTGFLPPKTNRQSSKKATQKSPKKSLNKRSALRSQIYTTQKKHRRDQLFDDDGEECFFCSIEEFCASFWMVFVALVVFIVTFTMMYSESDADTDFGVPVLTTRSHHRHYSMEEDIRFHKSVFCESKESFVYLRHNRTASTTMTNILQQFGYEKKLRFAIPSVVESGSCTTQFNITFAEMQRRKFNIMCNSARFNNGIFLKLMPYNTNYLTMLRNPLLVSYKVGLSNYSDVPVSRGLKDKCNPTVRVGYEMMYNFGFESSELHDDKQVEKAIKWIEKTFDLVMIEEYFHESLLLLKKVMCWSTEDITYYMTERGDVTANQTMSKTIRKDILASPDYRLYSHFNKTLWKKIADYGSSFKKDLDHLHLAMMALRNACQPRLEFYQQRREIHPLLLTKSKLLQKPSLSYCVNAIRNNSDFTRVLLEKQSVL